MRKIKRTLVVVTVLLCVVIFANLNAGKVKITVTASNSATEFKSIQDIAKMYMEIHPDINVSVYRLPMNSSERISLYLQTFQGKSGDINVMGIDGICAGDMADNLLDLNKYGAMKLTGTMFKTMVNGGNVKGRQVTIPFYADSPALYYRTDLLKKYNLKVPETWRDLAKAAYTIQQGERKTNPDFVGYVWEGEAYEGLTCCRQ